MRSREQFSDDGIGNLIFDDAGRFTHPGSMNNDLDVGNIRQGIERDSAQRPDSREDQQKCASENEKSISRAPINPSSDHVTFLPSRSRSVACSQWLAHFSSPGLWSA